MLKTLKFGLLFLFISTSSANASTEADFCMQFYYHTNGAGRVFVFTTEDDSPRVDVYKATFFHGQLLHLYSGTPIESHPIIEIVPTEDFTTFRAAHLFAKIYGLNGSNLSGNVEYENDTFYISETRYPGEPPEAYPCPN